MESAVDRWDILARASELAGQGVEFALATVVWRQAPSSGQTGSRMIITADGTMHGFIGGACAEPLVLREAQRVIETHEPVLLLLGTPQQFGDSVPEGMAVVPISCQSEGALQVYVEPVVPTPHLTIVGRSPMATTLGALAVALGWRADVVDHADLDVRTLDARSIVVIATQGHGDEDALADVLTAHPGFVGLVASHRRGEAVLGYLAERGVDRDLLARVQTPVGLDLGHTTHREIAVSVLAELVQRRAAGDLTAGGVRSGAGHGTNPGTGADGGTELAIDPVCGMTVRADPSSYPVEIDGTTQYFCCVGCRDTFVGAHASQSHSRGQEV